jgi:hypothetical protein
LTGDDDRAAKALIQAAPSSEIAGVWRRSFDEGGYRAALGAVLRHQISQDNRPCTNDPKLASRMLAVMAEPDRMFDCLDEAIDMKQPHFLAKLWPGYDPYREDARFASFLRRAGLEE